MSTATAEKRPIPSDARLVWMASERAVPLFRTLDRARAFDPLIVLLAILPVVVVMLAATCSDSDAAMALRALEALGVEIPPESQGIVRELVPNETVTRVGLWLCAAGLWGFGPQWPLSVLAASLLGGLALLPSLWVLARRMGGRRFAFWTVLLAAFHPAIIGAMLSALPVSAALAASLAAFWAHLRLAERGPWPLHAAIVAAGLAAAILIAGLPGALGAVVVAVEGLLAWYFRPRPDEQAHPPRTARAPGQVLGVRMAAIGAGLVLAGALGGFGIERAELATGGQDQGPFVIANRLEDSDIRVGPLWGLAAIGIWRLLRSFSRRGPLRVARGGSRLILIWLALFGIACLWNLPASESPWDPAGAFILAGGAIPMLAAVALAIEEASRRSVSGAWVMLAVLLPLAFRLGNAFAQQESLQRQLIWIVLGGILITAVWLVLLVLRAIISLPSQRRGLLMFVMLLAIGVDAADGFRRVVHHEQVAAPLSGMMARLREQRPREGAALLTKAPPPTRLVYAIRGVYPEVPMEIAPTWDEAAIRLGRNIGSRSPSLVAGAWGLGETIGAAVPEAVRPVGDPVLYEGRPLIWYVSEPKAERREPEIAKSDPGIGAPG